MFMKRKTYVDATSLTRHSTPFHEEKNSPKVKDCQIFYVIRVLEYSNTGVH